MNKEKSNRFLLCFFIAVLTFVAFWSMVKAIIDNSVVYCVIAMLAMNMLTKIRIDMIEDMINIQNRMIKNLISMQNQMITTIIKYWEAMLDELSKLC